MVLTVTLCVQMEQSLALGAAEPAPVVAERMAVVYQARVRRLRLS